jgi:hypothetical protein
MGKINKDLLKSKGLIEPTGRSYSNFTKSYLKLWIVGNFYLRITPKGNLQIFEIINGELIKTIKDEKSLDAFILFTSS